MKSEYTSDSTGLEVARALLRSGCVKLMANEPFRLPSGWATPVYMDCRRLYSFPNDRREIVAMTVALFNRQDRFKEVTCIAGAESSGIALAAWIAEAVDLPMVFVRKKPVGEMYVEGVISPNDHVLLVDDLMAAGHSKVNFCKALLDSGAAIGDVLVIFDYGVFPTEAILKPLGVRAHSLANWHDVLLSIQETGEYDAAKVEELKKFLSDPSRWSLEHGGISSAKAVF